MEVGFLRVSDLDRFFRGLLPERSAARTCDGLKAGDPATNITGVAVTWMADLAALREAVRLGFNCVVTHEPTFYNHWDRLEGLAEDAQVKAKQELIQRHNLVIYRVHDCWDTFPRYGVLDSWAAALGLADESASDGFHMVYALPPATLAETALDIKTKMRLPGLRVYGDPARTLSKFALGIGFWGQLDDVRAVLALGAECLVAGETCEWQAVSYARDAGLAVIAAGHRASENPGLRNLADYLRERLDGVPVAFLEGGEECSYL